MKPWDDYVLLEIYALAAYWNHHGFLWWLYAVNLAGQRAWLASERSRK
jgi:hypothetical protein